MRYKNRYLVFEVLWKDLHRAPEDVTPAGILQEIRKSLGDNFGDLVVGVTLPSLQVKYFNHQTGTLLLRCGRDEADRVWASVTLMNDLCHHAMMLHLVRLAGTLQGGKEGCMKHVEVALSRMRMTETDRETLRKEMRAQIDAIEI